MNRTSDLLRGTIAAILLALAVAFGAASALAPSASSTDDAQRPFVYYKCYVKGYGWMYCTDAAHS